MPDTGTATFTRSSVAASQTVVAPPPEMPVAPILSASTSGRMQR